MPQHAAFSDACRLITDQAYLRAGVAYPDCDEPVGLYTP